MAGSAPWRGGLRLWLFCLLLSALLPLPGRASARDPAVLVLFANEPGLPANVEAYRGLVSALEAKTPGRVSQYVEYLDVHRFPGKEHERQSADWYRERYAGVRLDVVVAVGAEALQFLVRHRGDLWTDVPVIFTGIPAGVLPPLPGALDVTGTTMHWEYGATLRAALDLVPGARRAVLVCGTSPADEVFRQVALRDLEGLAGRVEIADWQGLSLQDMESRAATLPDTDVMLFVSVFRDGAGQDFIPLEVASRLAAVSRRPMFATVGTGMGHGIVGGDLFSFEALGRATGEQVVRVLDGEPAGSLPVASPDLSEWRFDERQLQRFGLSPARLPEGSEVLFHAPSTWEQHRTKLLGVVVFCALQTGLILVLLAETRRRRRSEGLLDSRLRFEQLRARLVEGLSSPRGNDFAGRLRGALGETARQFGVERAFLVEVDEAGSRVAQAWLAEGEEPFEEEVPAATLPTLLARIREGRGVRVPGEDPVPAPDAAALEDRGVRSLLAAPLAAAGGVVGALVLSSRTRVVRWTGEDELRLGQVAEALANAVQHRRAGAAREAAEALNQAVLASQAGQLAVIDREGRVLSVNGAWGNGAGNPRAGAAVGSGYLQDPSLDDPARQALREVLEGAEERLLEYAWTDAEETRFGEFRVRRLARAEGGAVVSCQDITLRKRAEAEVQRHLHEVSHAGLVAAMGELAGAMAHELNQPLAASLGNAQATRRMLSAADPDLDEVREGLDDLIAENLRARDVMRRMRSVLQKGEFQVTPVDLAEVVAEVARLTATAASLRGISLALDLARPLPPVSGDRVQLQQVALNLVMNALDACEATASGRQVLVRTSCPEDGRVTLEVRDTGPGLDPQGIEEIFRPYFTTKKHGMGLGLSICRTIVELHGGNLTAENLPEGGAVFRVTLPQAAA